MVARIAPYIATNIQRSYLRQQRVGERIADAKAKKADETSTFEVEISNAAHKAAEEAEATALIHKTMKVEQMADRFVDRFLSPPKQDEAESSGDGDEDADPGRTAFVRLIESFGLEVKQGDDGEDRAITNKATGEDLIPLSPESRDIAKTELKDLVKNILNEVL